MDLQNERIELVNIEDEMQRDYIDYSMSVIIGRALPDARDGLKPVNRRILYAMQQGGWYSNRAFVKCARVVGEVMGKYHPHGDSAVYDSLVRMAQDFSMRFPLIHSQGNFGSIDGDPPAAYRYTECKLNKLAEEMLADIGKRTVDMRKNFDESLDEPSVLPCRIPNLLANGSTGIAVGMATNVPPHNLDELIDALIHLIDHREASVRDLMQFVKGPDFPTGATIRGVNEIIKMYETGRGLIRIRGKADIFEDAKGKETIIINEIPFTVNKANLITKMAALVREKKLEGISDIRDESNKEGIRVVIEIKRNAMANVVLNNLYKQTMLQYTFGAIMLAIDKGRPKVMNLRELLDCFLAHRFEVITRRTQFDLEKAEARAHILEGLLKALDHLDDVVKIIRSSSTRDEARERLMSTYDFTKIQANSILEMRLYQLTGLERDKLQAEYDELMEHIAYLTDLLAHPEKIYDVIKEDLEDVRSNYGNPRRTEITADDSEINLEDLIEDRPCVITISHTGYIKRVPLDVYREQRRGGKGVMAMTTKDEDFVESVYFASTHDYLLCFTELGRVFWKKVYEIPESSRTGRGKAIVNLLDLQQDEKIATIVRVREFSKDQFLVFATKNGVAKKTNLSAFGNIRTGGIIAINIDTDDLLIGVKLTSGTDDLILVTSQGMSTRFNEEQLRDQGRATRGVRGIRLGKEGDRVVGLVVVQPDAHIIVMSEKGYGKRTSFEEYPTRNRGGKGVITMRISEKNGLLIAANAVVETEALMLVTEKGQMVRTPIDSISIIGRATQGVRLVNVGDDDRLVAAAPVAREDGEPDELDPDGEAVPAASAEGEAPPATEEENTSESEAPPAAGEESPEEPS